MILTSEMLLKQLHLTKITKTNSPLSRGLRLGGFMYTAPEWFIKDIKRIHNKLDCEYVPKYERFIVTCELPTGESAPVFIVGDITPGIEGFRYPDKRDVDALHECDLEKETIEDKFAKIAKKVSEEKQKEWQVQKDMIKERTMDDKIQLMNKFQRLTGSGKGNSAFRRIDPDKNSTKTEQNNTNL